MYQIERFHTPGASESERLKVTALNLFHPTASPPLFNHRVLGIAIQSQRGEGRVTGPALLYVLVEKEKMDYNYLKKGERR